ncbi:type II toxin-antitoxin system PemK/MazF family toxin [Elizabethkingia miricola]|uniref:type II toxin-antitoxin system PemK/MazF family toxin n=1 Tax=Elizabethkingia miricola TaxID=172045 RepID=UPI0020192BE3|nr:type II toxin-antitoxin system PemK/MazF family toxin [Elizabethkingia miricola]MCL1654914.1 type II toxin-antitoxin system PemK/MazF family toxin [Elizabethkingia miricola]
MVIKRFDIFFIDLNPTVGSEINKIRPCVIISPDEMNNALNTVIIAPLTSTIKSYPMRVNCKVEGKRGQVALDHLRSVDKRRLKAKMASLDKHTQEGIKNTLIDMFT